MSNTHELSDELLELILENLNPNPHGLGKEFVIEGIANTIRLEQLRRRMGPFYLSEVAASGRKFRLIGLRNGYIQCLGESWTYNTPEGMASVLGDYDIQSGCIRAGSSQFEPVFEYVEDDEDDNE